MLGGVFYVIGGALVVALAGTLSSLGGFSDLGLGGLSNIPGLNGLDYPTTNETSAGGLSLGTSGINDIVYLVGGFGILAGILMIFGGYLLQMEKPGRRKAGGILAAVMLLLGALPALGGLFIGFILGAIGCYLGLTYKAARSNFTVGLGPVGSVTLGPSSIPGHTADAPSEAGNGPLNYCIKCGTRLRDGSVFCGACGARIPA